MTKRLNKVGRKLVQSIEANNRKKLVKSTNGQFIHWNQELKLSDEVRNPKKYPSVIDRQESKRRPDKWHYSREDKYERKELVLNIVEINIPWNDAVINPEKFQKDGDKSYKLRPFRTQDVNENTLAAARSRKIEKYEPIIKEAAQWLRENSEQICILHKVSDIRVVARYVIISSLGIVPKATEDDVCSIISSEKKDKLRYGRMWLKRMINQAIRGSFECCFNPERNYNTME
jgi:hypothetical protein